MIIDLKDATDEVKRKEIKKMLDDYPERIKNLEQGLHIMSLLPIMMIGTKDVMRLISDEEFYKFKFAAESLQKSCAEVAEELGNALKDLKRG